MRRHHAKTLKQEVIAKLLRQPLPASKIRSQCSLESVYNPLCPQFLPWQELRQEFCKYLTRHD